MNERIRELVGQAKFMAEETINKQISKNAELDAFAEKFAELVVRECVGICNKIYFDRYPDAEEWERSEEGDAIKKHFGVDR
jgi:hypothetical protein